MKPWPALLTHNRIAQKMVYSHHRLAPAPMTDNYRPAVRGELSVQLCLPRARFVGYGDLQCCVLLVSVCVRLGVRRVYDIQTRTRGFGGTGGSRR